MWFLLCPYIKNRKRVSRHAEDNSCSVWNVLKVVITVILVASIIILGLVTFWSLQQIKDLRDQLNSCKFHIDINHMLCLLKQRRQIKIEKKSPAEGSQQVYLKGAFFTVSALYIGCVCWNDMHFVSLWLAGSAHHAFMQSKSKKRVRGMKETTAHF